MQQEYCVNSALITKYLLSTKCIYKTKECENIHQYVDIDIFNNENPNIEKYVIFLCDKHYNKINDEAQKKKENINKILKEQLQDQIKLPSFQANDITINDNRDINLNQPPSIENICNSCSTEAQNLEIDKKKIDKTLESPNYQQNENMKKYFRQKLLQQDLEEDLLRLNYLEGQLSTPNQLEINTLLIKIEISKLKQKYE